MYYSLAASVLEELGAGAPGVDQMWGELRQIYPHTEYASGGFGFIMLLATNIILRFIAGIAVLMIVYGGIRMIMTVADDNAHAEAKKIIQYAAIGLILTIMTDAIVMYVMSILQMATDV